MSSITVTLSEERLAQLREMADQLRTTPEDLARASIEDLLARSEKDFDTVAQYVLKKNAELYRRLA